MHDDAYIGGRSENNINASCMTISGGRTKQLDIFCRITGFMSDFLSFIVVELIRFFHEALQLPANFIELPLYHNDKKFLFKNSWINTVIRLITEI